MSGTTPPLDPDSHSDAHSDARTGPDEDVLAVGDARVADAPEFDAEDVPPPPPPADGHPLRRSDDARMWASFCHLAGLSTLIQVPGVVGCLIVWLVKRESDPFIDEAGKEAVNFQLNLLIFHIIGAVMALMTCGVAVFVYVPLFLLAALVLPILATIAASEGKPYRYPFIYRFLS